MKALVVVPAYNEELNIVNTVNDLKTNAEYVDYIVVNDGSKDSTLQVLKEHQINHIDSLVNLGLFGAVQTGFKYALVNGYDVAIQFDGDGQHDARYIRLLLDEIEKGNDIVIGSRFVSEKKPFTARMLGSRLIAFAIRLTTGKKITDPTSGFRAIAGDSLKDFALDMNNPPEPDTLVYMIRKGRKVKEVQVEMRDREFGESYLNLANTIKYMTRIMVSILFVQQFRK